VVLLDFRLLVFLASGWIPVKALNRPDLAFIDLEKKQPIN